MGSQPVGTMLPVGMANATPNMHRCIIEAKTTLCIQQHVTRTAQPRADQCKYCFGLATVN